VGLLESVGPLGANGRPTAFDLGLMPARGRVSILAGPMEPGGVEGCVGSVGTRGCRWSRLVVPNHRQTSQIMLILSVVLKVPAPSRRERQRQSKPR
jgi:hypothetical protein